MRNIRSEQEIMANWKGDPSQLVVSICCITYNHEHYIEDAIEGFLIQETDFPFEILIHDDASTDRTADIIREYEAKYPHLIKPIYQTKNKYSQGKKPNPEFNFPRAKGEYIALCEGDDYWIDPKKLEIQLNFMKIYPECSMCFHKAKILNYGKIKYTRNYTYDYGNILFFERNKLFYEGGSNSPTASIFFRKFDIEKLPDWFRKAPVGDMPLKLILSYNGKIGFINKVMGVRRIGVPDSWNIRTRLNKENQNNYLIGMIEMLKNFNKYSGYFYDKEVTEKIISYESQKNGIGICPWKNIPKLYSNYLFNFPFDKKLKLYLKNYLYLLKKILIP